MRDIDISQICICGEIMTRMVSLPQPAIMVITNTEKMTKTLNDQEGGYKLPGGNGHRERYRSVIADSLTRDRLVIGKGF